MQLSSQSPSHIFVAARGLPPAKQHLQDVSHSKRNCSFVAISCCPARRHDIRQTQCQPAASAGLQRGRLPEFFPSSRTDVYQAGAASASAALSAGVPGGRAEEAEYRRPSAEEVSAPPESAVTRISGPEDLQAQLGAAGEGLVVLMCKAHSCRPCKMFSRKFNRIAQQFSDKGIQFLEVFGDDSRETRQMMRSMAVKVTPDFRFYRQGKEVHSLCGINETNLRNAVESHW